MVGSGRFIPNGGLVCKVHRSGQPSGQLVIGSNGQLVEKRKQGDTETRRQGDKGTNGPQDHRTTGPQDQTKSGGDWQPAGGPSTGSGQAAGSSMRKRRTGDTENRGGGRTQRPKNSRDSRDEGRGPGRNQVRSRACRTVASTRARSGPEREPTVRLTICLSTASILETRTVLG